MSDTNSGAGYRFGRVLSLIVGKPGQPVSAEDKARYAATRARLESLVEQASHGPFPAAQAQALSAELRKEEASLKSQLAAANARGGTGFEITDLRVTFDIVKDNSKHTNKSRVEIYGLAEPSRQAILKPDVRCLLKAGYAEENGPVEMYRGDVTFGWTRFEGADVVTTLELGDTAKQVRDTVVALSYPSGASAKAALRAVAARMGLTVSMPSDLQDRPWPGGLSLHGSARAALDRITRGAGWSWSVQNGVLQVLGPNGFNNRSVIDLALDSGLVGYPERQRRGSHEAEQAPVQAARRRRRAAAATQKWDGWRVQSLLLPTLQPGDRVKLSSRTVNSILTVRKVRHHGDTHGGDWMSDLDLLDPAEQPKPATRGAAAP